MTEAWESWTLFWMAILQFVVAYLWWRGDHLEGSRGWVPTLFVLNGFATAFNASADLTNGILLDAVGTVFDRWTNFALLAIGLLALDPEGHRRRARRVGLALWAPVFAWGSWHAFRGRLGAARPENLGFVVDGTLFLAIILGALAFVAHFRRPDERTSMVWALVLAGLGIRYAELSTWFGLGRLEELLASPPAGAAALALQSLRPLGLVAIAGAFLAAFVLYTRAEAGHRSSTRELCLLLLLAGFLVGFSHRFATGSQLAVVFTLGLVRPLVFLEGQQRLQGRSLWSSPRRGTLLAGGGVYLVSLIGILVAGSVDIPLFGQLLWGLAFLVVGVWATTRIPRAGEDTTPSSGPEASSQRSWPVDEEGVSLPDDWRRRCEEGYELYRELPAATQANLDRLAHWQRILLALDGAPEGDELPAYERTTPGLHLVTHCPYPHIGPEIRRMNDRAEEIVEEWDLDPGEAEPSGPLVEGSFGRAEGLDSPRAKFYQLTPTGERVARRIREELGLDDAPAERAAKVVAEGFAEA